MFKFDFSPVQQAAVLPLKTDNPEQKKPAADSLKKDSLKAKIDSLAAKPDSSALAASLKPEEIKKNNSKEDKAKTKTEDKKTLAAADKKIQSVQANFSNTAQTQAQVLPSTPPVVTTKSKKDTVYTNWIKQTVKLYESMDSRKAAKVIQGYSDNIARDILLKMKKKKAAEILAELKPEVVTRIISVN